MKPKGAYRYRVTAAAALLAVCWVASCKDRSITNPKFEFRQAGSGLTVYVTSSAAAKPLAGVDLRIQKNPACGWGSVREAEGGGVSAYGWETVTPVRTDAEGKVVLKAAKPGEVYSVLATKEGYAHSLLQECRVVWGGQVEVIQLLPKLPEAQDGRGVGAPYLKPADPAAEAKETPVVWGAENGLQLADAAPDSESAQNAFRLPLTTVRFDSPETAVPFQFTAYSREALLRQNSHDEVSVALDQTPSGFVPRFSPASAVQSEPDTSHPYWESSFESVIRGVTLRPQSIHSLNWVVTDIANNRTQKRIWILQNTPSVGAPFLSEKSLFFTAEARTFPVDRRVFSAQAMPAKPKETTAYTLLTIDRLDANDYDEYEVARSEQRDKAYEVIKRLRASQMGADHTLLDDSPELKINGTYYYRIRGFKDATGSDAPVVSEWGGPRWVYFLPKLTVADFSPNAGAHSFKTAAVSFAFPDFADFKPILNSPDAESVFFLFNLWLETIDKQWSLTTERYTVPELSYEFKTKSAVGYTECKTSTAWGTETYEKTFFNADTLLSFAPKTGTMTLKLSDYINTLLEEGSVKMPNGNVKKADLPAWIPNHSYNWHIGGGDHGAYIKIKWNGVDGGTSVSYASSAETAGAVGGQTFNIQLTE